jgi:hypothetical protein
MSSLRSIFTAALLSSITGFSALAQDIQEPLGQLGHAKRDAPLRERMANADLNFILAFDASICQLRSDAWFKVMKYAWELYSQDAIRQSGMSYKEANELLGKVRALATMKFGEPPAICAKLLNSDIMDALDRIQYKLTGGYH